MDIGPDADGEDLGFGKCTTHVACSSQPVVALAASGQLYTWGMGLDGRLGHGDQANRDGPTVVQAFEEAGVGITAIAAGCSHSLAGDAQGNLWSWGCALEGALGLGPENLDEAVLSPTMLVRCHP